MEKEKKLGFELNCTGSYIRIAVMKLLKDLGITDITHEQFGILFLLSEEDGLYQRQLAFSLSKDRPNITRMLDILEKKGYICREKHPENKRISKVYITEEGRKKVEKAAPYKEQFNSKMHKGISDEELTACIAVLRKVRDNLADSCNLQI